MNTIRVNQKIFFLCGDCKGIAVNFSVLKGYLSVSLARKIWTDLRAAKASTKKCPVCPKPMKTIYEPDLAHFYMCSSCRITFFSQSQKKYLSEPFQRENSWGLAIELNKQERNEFASALVQTEAMKRSGIRDAVDPKGSLWRALGLPLTHDGGLGENLSGVNCILAILMVVLTVFNVVLINGSENYFLFSIDSGQWYRNFGLNLITGTFAHASLLHMAINLFFISKYGGFAEQWLGRARYLGLFVSAEVLGKIFLVLQNPDVIYVGCGAFVSALVTVLSLKHTRERIPLNLTGHHGSGFPIWGLILLVPWLNSLGLEMFALSDMISEMSWWPFFGGSITGLFFWALIDGPSQLNSDDP